MPRIGEILSRSVPLSGHDLEEILQEQKSTRQRFGEAALSLGKANPQQVWDAWIAQIRHQPVDPARLKPDTAAMDAVPVDLALTFNIVPMRLRGTQLVIATAEDLAEPTVRQIARRCGLEIIVARASRPAIERAMAKLYPTTAPVAA